MKDKKPKQLKWVILFTAIVIVGILLLNIIVGALADRFPFTIDMSSDKVFTLSEESKAVAESIEKDVKWLSSPTLKITSSY